MSQEKIWDYFQGEAVENFAGAVPRLNFLFRKALKVTGNRDISVLNIGVGDGWLERRCVRQGWKTHSIDPSAPSVERLAGTGTSARVGYIEKMPYGDGTFDVVFCSEVLEHLSDDQLDLGLGEVERILRRGGFLIGTVPYNENLSESTVVCPDCGKVFHRWGHMRSFDRDGLRSAFAKADLRVVALTTHAFPDPSRNAGPYTVRQLLRWFLGRIGSAQVYVNLFFMVQNGTADKEAGRRGRHDVGGSDG